MVLMRFARLLLSDNQSHHSFVLSAYIDFYYLTETSVGPKVQFCYIVWLHMVSLILLITAFPSDFDFAFPSDFDFAF